MPRMADPRNSDDFMTGLVLGLMIAGGFEEDGPDFDMMEDRLREQFRGRWPFPFPLRHFMRRRRRVADLAERVAKLERQSESVAASVGTFAWALSSGARPDDMDQLVALPVRVYLETDSVFSPHLVDAAQNFVGALGFEVIATGEPQYGSFRRRFVSALRGFFSKKQTQDALEKGARAIELQLLDRPQAEATNVLAEATAKLLQQVKDQKGAVCLLVGSILLVRYRPEGKKEFVIAVRTLSPVQLRRLEENQAQLDEPGTILQWLGAPASGRLPSPE